MSDKNISQKVFDKIKDENIRPKPKWNFILKDYSIWLIGFISLVIGTLAFSVILHIVINNDWDVYKNFNKSIVEFMVLSMPYFWLLIMVTFGLAASYNFRHTKKGYRYSVALQVSLLIILSVFSGGILYNLGIGEVIDETLAENMPTYAKYLEPRRPRWLQAEKGFLAGVVIRVESQEKKFFELKDFNNETWYVINEDPMPKHSILIENGNKIRIIGVKIEHMEFRAERIMPFFKEPAMPMMKFQFMQ